MSQKESLYDLVENTLSETYSIKSTLIEITDLLQDISGIKNELNHLNTALNYQNNLIYKLCIYFEKQLNNGNKSTSLPIEDIIKFQNKNLLIVGKHYNDTIFFTKELAKQSNTKCWQLEKPFCSSGDIVAVLNNAKKGDYIFLDYKELTDNIISTLIYAIKNNGYLIKVGNGDEAIEMKFNIQVLNYVVYTGLEEIVDTELLELLEVIK